MDACMQLSVPVLDLWSYCEGDSDNRALYLIDGLHLNAKFEFYNNIFIPSFDYLPAAAHINFHKLKNIYA